jgi:hypothetical protein
MNASPDGAGPWDPAGYYELTVDANEDLVEDITWRFTFPVDSAGVQHVVVAELTGRKAADRHATGRIITPRNAPVGEVREPRRGGPVEPRQCHIAVHLTTAMSHRRGRGRRSQAAGARLTGRVGSAGQMVRGALAAPTRRGASRPALRRGCRVHADPGRIAQLPEAFVAGRDKMPGRRPAC